MRKDLYVSALLDVYGQFLSEKQRNPALMYYNEDLSLSEIAEIEGITRQGVSDLIKRAEVQLREWEESCGYCDAFLRLKALASEIKAGSIEKQNELFELIDDI